ncbi:hypothetical protein CPB84DRAFT_1669630 [Gymnopilus junonius]|uniref:Ubiquitin carboxyl-terminal hydrolase n=1 Tax=Gymnopilus junonius TaxID=109634 RepID=A0A9P5P258_GYMJU|nr:hypothetical protein CPB84DRAFT_1669630 [Gymnopilus junonius]
MLASPFLPSAVFSQHPSDDPLQYRPSKDMEAFNSLLPPPVEFVEGSSSGTLAVAEGKYEPINASPKLSKAEPSSPVSPKPSHTAPRATNGKVTSLYPAAIDTTWPQSCQRGSGLYNSGNTCFMNSALQCLLHTPPLLKLLLSHKRDLCRVSSGFCMSCGLRQTATKSYSNDAPFSPVSISQNLQIIAKHMRKGRQEDSHEFLRYAIDALQKSCLAGYPPKLDSKIAETTWVHKLFGGRLRSRVTCRDCGHNSDTFDRILDLSLDIFKCDSLREALRKFVAIDYLKGADKYKCEKCKKYVNAEKRFTIHEAPLVLTVHLKRFSPLGRKISHLLQYDQELTLKPYMSAGEFGPSYSLYGVICHAGGGPNSGHYYAFIKGRDGSWWEMNDDIVSRTSPPTDKKNAYILFYMQNKGQGLEAAVKAPLQNYATPFPVPAKNGLAAGMKKKTQKPSRGADEEEDKGVKVSATFIGPLLPSPQITTKGSDSAEPPTPTTPDPQATNLKAKIEAAAKSQARSALESLGNYASEESDDKDSEAPAQSDYKMDADVDVKGKGKKDGAASSRPSSPAAPPLASSSRTIPASIFYASVNNRTKKRKISEVGSENHGSSKKPFSPLQARTKGYITSNPFNVPSSAKRKRMGI